MGRQMRVPLILFLHFEIEGEDRLSSSSAVDFVINSQLHVATNGNERVDVDLHVKRTVGLLATFEVPLLDAEISLNR